MKKILILCNHEIVLYNFKKELIEQLSKTSKVFISMPFEETLDFFQAENHCECIETKVDRRGINPIKDVKLLLFYRKLIKNVKPDIIFTLTIKPTIYGGLVSRLYRIPLVTNITGIGTTFQNDGLLKKIVVNLYKVALKRCSTCFFENKENLEVFLKHRIIDERQALPVHGAGVNLSEFKYSNVYHKKLIVGFVGRVMKEKGIEEFFYCVEHPDFLNIDFRVYGFCEDDYMEKLNELSKRPNFKYMGFSNDRNRMYNEIDCLILPSYHEGMSNVLLEASACGRLIITTNICGCKEAIINNESGYLVPVGSKEELYLAMKKVASMSSDEKISMGKKGRTHMEQSFDRCAIIKQYINALEESISL